mmetsp:Transcript_7656/g.26188  ORF Transcript_7656/g.26188 Transcript_7656/m.26188 type:complete len:228 (-) Transcript_7656:211-894(-)
MPAPPSMTSSFFDGEHCSSAEKSRRPTRFAPRFSLYRNTPESCGSSLTLTSSGRSGLAGSSGSWASETRSASSDSSDVTKPPSSQDAASASAASYSSTRARISRFMRSRMRCTRPLAVKFSLSSSGDGALAFATASATRCALSRSSASSRLSLETSSRSCLTTASRALTSTSLTTALFFMFFDRSAYRNVDAVSDAESDAGDTVATMVVRALPPSESLRRCVSTESR